MSRTLRGFNFGINSGIKVPGIEPSMCELAKKAIGENVRKKTECEDAKA